MLPGIAELCVCVLKVITPKSDDWIERIFLSIVYYQELAISALQFKIAQSLTKYLLNVLNA